MNPQKQPMTREELVAYANSLRSEIIKLNQAFGRLHAQVKEAQALNDLQLEQIRSLKEERILRHYGP